MWQEERNGAKKSSLRILPDTFSRCVVSAPTVGVDVVEGGLVSEWVLLLLSDGRTYTALVIRHYLVTPLCAAEPQFAHLNLQPCSV